MRTSTPLWLLGALGALSLSAIDPAAAADPAQWTCEKCPFEKPARAASVEPFGGSSGSAVDSSCAQRRPNRVGGRTNVTGSRQALKRTMNDSSATGSPTSWRSNRR